jgi:hypothetical protein
MTFKGSNKKIPEIVKELNVRYVLEGSVRRSGDSLRSARLPWRSPDSCCRRLEARRHLRAFGADDVVAFLGNVRV